MKFRYWPLALFVLAACAASADGLILDAESGCAVENPKPKAGEAVSWSGSCLNGAAHGPGTLRWFLHGEPNGRFVGNLSGGQVAGEGTAFYPSGNRYSGGFEGGVPNGSGTLYYADGRRYVGGWTDGRPDGAGVMFDTDGSAEPQTWKEGRRIN